MPTPSRTSVAGIVAAGRELLESDGLDRLTMQGVASAVGVRAPSLYKHVSGRGQLIELITENVVRELADTLERSIDGTDPRHDLTALAYAFRDFAHRHPEGYRLIFFSASVEWHLDPDRLVAALEPVLRTTTALAGERRALEAARTVTAWAHGFVTMELAGAFRLGGNVEEAFEYGIERIGRALASI